MADKKKKFFTDRTVAQMKKMCNVIDVDSPEGLVTRIEELDPENECLRLHLDLYEPKPQFRLTALTFLQRARGDTAYASRMALRHGLYLMIPQPGSGEDAHAELSIPLRFRQEALRHLHDPWNIQGSRAYKRRADLREDEIFILGYGFRPLVGSMRQQKVHVPFVSLLDGCRIDSYSVSLKKKFPGREDDVGITVRSFDDVESVAHEGAKVLVYSPSRRKGKRRYASLWSSVAVRDTPEKRVIRWGTLPRQVLVPGQESAGPMSKIILDIRYDSLLRATSRAGIVTVSPHDIAEHEAIIRHYFRGADGIQNMIPFESSQYAVPSRMTAEFFGRLNNNLFVVECGGSVEPKERPLHLDEKTVLLARHVAQRGPYETLVWDSERDGKISQYDWGNRAVTSR